MSSYCATVLVNKIVIIFIFIVDLLQSIYNINDGQLSGELFDGQLRNMWVKQEPDDFLQKMDCDDQLPSVEPENLGPAIDECLSDFNFLNYSSTKTDTAKSGTSILHDVINSVDTISSASVVNIEPPQQDLTQSPTIQSVVNPTNKHRNIQLHSQLAGHIAAAAAKSSNLPNVPVLQNIQKPTVVTIPQVQTHVSSAQRNTLTTFSQATNKVNIVNPILTTNLSSPTVTTTTPCMIPSVPTTHVQIQHNVQPSKIILQHVQQPTVLQTPAVQAKQQIIITSAPQTQTTPSNTVGQFSLQQIQQVITYLIQFLALF